MSSSAFAVEEELPPGVKKSFPINHYRRLEMNREIRGRISYFVSVTDYYVITDEDLFERDKISKSLAEMENLEEFPVEQWFDTNFTCLAPRGVAWARARIRELTKELDVHVHFVDWGDCAKLPLGSVKRIPPDLLYVHPLAHHLCGYQMKSTEDAEKVLISGACQVLS